MFTIKNLLNQPLMVEGQSLGVDSTMKARSVTDEIRRLADKGFVRIIEPAPKAPATPTEKTNTPAGGKETK